MVASWNGVAAWLAGATVLLCLEATLARPAVRTLGVRSPAGAAPPPARDASPTTHPRVAAACAAVRMTWVPVNTTGVPQCKEARWWKWDPSSGVARALLQRTAPRPLAVTRCDPKPRDGLHGRHSWLYATKRWPAPENSIALPRSRLNDVGESPSRPTTEPRLRSVPVVLVVLGMGRPIRTSPSLSSTTRRRLGCQ